MVADLPTCQQVNDLCIKPDQQEDPSDRPDITRSANTAFPWQHPPGSQSIHAFEVGPWRTCWQPEILPADTLIRFTEWSKLYGGLFTLKLGTATMVVITDRRIAKDLDKKANIYSQRPDSYVSHDLITKGNHLLVMHYGTDSILLAPTNCSDGGLQGTQATNGEHFVS